MGWGSSTRRGGGRKVRALPRSLTSLAQGPWVWRRGGPPGVFKKFLQKKKVCVQVSFSREKKQAKSFAPVIFSPKCFQGDPALVREFLFPGPGPKRAQKKKLRPATLRAIVCSLVFNSVTHERGYRTKSQLAHCCTMQSMVAEEYAQKHTHTHTYTHTHTHTHTHTYTHTHTQNSAKNPQKCTMSMAHHMQYPLL